MLKASTAQTDCKHVASSRLRPPTSPAGGGEHVRTVPFLLSLTSDGDNGRSRFVEAVASSVELGVDIGRRLCRTLVFTVEVVLAPRALTQNCRSLILTELQY